MKWQGPARPQYADGTARAGTQSTDEIRAAIAELLRFRSVVGANFPAVMKAAQDLANTFGGDLRGDVQAFGRAFEDPINGLDGLRAAGLRISPVQEKLIADFARSSQLARAYAEILRLASEQLGGATAKSADTTSAAYGRLTNSVSRFFEVAGKSGDLGLRSVLDWLAQKAHEAADAMERLQHVQNWLVTAPRPRQRFYRS